MVQINALDGSGAKCRPVRRGGDRDLGVHDPRLDDGNPLGGVEPQNAGQAVEGDDDAVRDGQRAARQAGAAAARDKGQAFLVAEADQLDHFVRGLRDGHRQGARAESRQRIALVGGQLLGPGEHPVGREQGSEPLEGVRHSHVHYCPSGTTDNSPAFQRWVSDAMRASPEGTVEKEHGSAVPSGLDDIRLHSQR